MVKNYNVLVFPGGTEIGLEIQKALSQCKGIHLFSAGMDVSNHAPFVFARHFIVPSIDNPCWIERLNDVILQNSIDYIFPAHDDVLVALAENSGKIKARIVSSPLETCVITRSKSQTYRFLFDTIPTPRLYSDVTEVEQFPVFVKPDKGQGSQGTNLVKNYEQLAYILNKESGYIILEYLPGDEYTIDCFSDREKGLLFCSGRQRVRTRSGISMASCFIHNDIFLQYARAIENKISFHGAWFFQVKQDRFGQYKLLEIAPRIAGTMALNRVQGVNFALLSIYEQERISIEILVNNANIQIDRALVNHYKHSFSYSTVYIDLDDTLILNGNVNIHLIQFIYQCINLRRRVVLLTKHIGELDTTLKQYRLAGIFDEIIHIGHSETKADYIHENDAILIDDSFSERKSVHDRLGIPTFDCSMIEVLIDDRI